MPFDTQFALTPAGAAYCEAAELRAGLIAHGAAFPFTIEPTNEGFLVRASADHGPGKLSDLSLLGEAFGQMGFCLTFRPGEFVAYRAAPTPFDPQIARWHETKADREWREQAEAAGQAIREEFV